MDFLALAKEKMQLVEMDRSFMSRSVNEGFSGGEKKRNEILQMAILEPKLAILDETDSGLDIDALRVVAGGVNALEEPGPGHARHHPSPAAARLHRPRPRPRPRRGPDRPLRRQGASRALEEHGYVDLDQVRLAPLASVDGKAMTTGGDLMTGVAVAPAAGLTLLAPESDGPDWLSEVRRSASDWIGAHGFPTRKDEDWRYTRLEPMLAVPFERAPPGLSHNHAQMALDGLGVGLGGARLVFVNGLFAPELSHVEELPAAPG